MKRTLIFALTIALVILVSGCARNLENYSDYDTYVVEDIEDNEETEDCSEEDEALSEDAYFSESEENEESDDTMSEDLCEDEVETDNGSSNTAPETTHVTNDNGIKSISFEDASKKGGLYVMKQDGTLYSTRGVQLSFGQGSVSRVDFSGLTLDPDSQIVTCNLAEGDQLVTFSAYTDYGFAPVTRKGYVCQGTVRIQSGVKLEEVYSVRNSTYKDLSIDELDGIPVTDEESLRSVVESKGATIIGSGFYQYIYSDSPKTFTAGYYSGTKFIESPVSLDTNYYEFGQKVPVPVEKTKDGYFVVDLTSIDSGLQVCSYDFQKYVINIIR